MKGSQQSTKAAVMAAAMASQGLKSKKSGVPTKEAALIEDHAGALTVFIRGNAVGCLRRPSSVPGDGEGFE